MGTAIEQPELSLLHVELLSHIESQTSFPLVEHVSLGRIRDRSSDVVGALEEIQVWDVQLNDKPPVKSWYLPAHPMG